VLPGWLELLAVAAVLALALFVSAYALGQEDGTVFCLFLLFLSGVCFALARCGFFGWFGGVGQRHRQVINLGAFAVAFLFPFTQGGSDANMSIATQVLIFAATAMGLNIVVGLAGLLDLGYIAFLGAGAYVAAMLSTSAFATVGWKPPFFVVVIIGALVSATLGLIIGTPTLRVSGDYLAIVTLAFGEIFRLSMGNLDGINGPDLTNGPNGIPAIPDLEIGSFNFGDSHVMLGVSIGRFGNYYFLLLLLTAFIITVFVRLNNSRIGRGWIAIREDEKAAEAMGVNTFGLKLFAFAGGAFLAGMAGTVKAHQDVSVTPDQYVFLESAFLLAAIVLGGMGTVAGVLVGATILKLLPEKLRFVSDYRLLLFGLLLVLIMRFRPEGLVPNRRRQLEFHEEDTALAERIEEEHLEVTAQLEDAAEPEAKG
jgi:branched-chain amino acid transport system permease protein